MAVELVRIDDRLIHGQVASTWINDYNIEQVLIINDLMVNDEIQKSIMNMTAPSHIKVMFFGIEQFNGILVKTEIKRRTMLLFTTPVDVLNCIMRGNLHITKLNVGNIRFKEGRKKIAFSVSLAGEEADAFKKMIAMGIDVYYQMVPREEIVSFSSLLNVGL
jgi:PTS system mannose-specific IIB component